MSLQRSTLTLLGLQQPQSRGNRFPYIALVLGVAVRPEPGYSRNDARTAPVCESSMVTTARSHALAEASSAFIWTWLPGEVQPVPAGRLHRGTDGRHDFGYMSDYLDRPNAIALGPDLPLSSGMRALPGAELTGTLRDATPGAWGRRVLRALQLDRRGAEIEIDIGDIGYGLLAGTDGIGALSYQASATSFEARLAPVTELEALAEAVARVELGLPLPPELAAPLTHAVTIGGSRPKAIIDIDGRCCIARFASVHDQDDVLLDELSMLQLARSCHIDVPQAEMRKVGDRQVLLVDRFDRTSDKASRQGVISGRTLTGLSGQQECNVGWPYLAGALSRQEPMYDQADAWRELFRRIVFDIFIDHADAKLRGPSFLWSGATAKLAPAGVSELRQERHKATSSSRVSHRDISPANIARACDAATKLGLDQSVALAIIEQVRAGIADHDPAAMYDHEILSSYQ